jgi:hypothetical protein
LLQHLAATGADRRRDDGHGNAGRASRRGRRPAAGACARAWLVAAVTFLALLASAAFRSSLGVLLVPIEDDLGWTRTQTSVAVSLNLLVYGLAAPFAAALLERGGGDGLLDPGDRLRIPLLFDVVVVQRS